MAYIGNNLQAAFTRYLNIDDISGSFNGVTTSFALQVNGVTPSPFPINSQQCLISVGGVIQRPDDTGSEGFRLSGGNIIFSSAPNTGEDFFGVILAGADYVNVGANFPDGQVGAPSITFDQDVDTGLYRSGANQLSVTTGGTERIRFDSSGQIESVSLGSASAPVFSYTTDPNTGTFSPGADTWAVSTGGVERYRVDSSGRLLVGTSANYGGNVVQIQGPSSTAAASVGSLTLRSGYTPITNLTTDPIGKIDFQVADGGVCAQIQGYTNGANVGTNDYPGALLFSTTADGASSPTERMRIRSSGEVLVNSTALLDLNGQAFQVNGWSMFYQATSGTTASAFTHIQSGTQTLCLFRQGNPAATVGSISVSGGTTTTYNTSSDYRLKENVVEISDGIDRLLQLKPSRFNFISNPGKTVDGFIAHEVQDIVPEAITGEKDAVDDEGNPIYQGIDQSKLVPLLTAALQEAVAKIESLEARLTAANI